MQFTKMQGTGNDFIIIDNTKENLPIDSLGYIASILCKRRLSLGADGLIVVDRPDSGGDYKMRFYNSDGSIAEMCGNGARCVARYGYENGFAGEIQRIETMAGLVEGRRINERLYQIRLNTVTAYRHNQKATIKDKEYIYDYIELGNPPIPHIAVNIPGLKEIELDSIKDVARELRYCKTFPKGVNVNLYEITGPDQVLLRTYERGVEDFTMACGTGTGSMVYALTKEGMVTGHDVKVSVPGGELFINIVKEEDSTESVFLTGLTNVVAKGVILDEELTKTN